MVFLRQTFCLVYELFHVATQLFCLGQSCKDAFMLDQLSAHGFNHTPSMFGAAVQLPKLITMPHIDWIRLNIIIIRVSIFKLN